MLPGKGPAPGALMGPLEATDRKLSLKPHMKNSLWIQYFLRQFQKVQFSIQEHQRQISLNYESHYANLKGKAGGWTLLSCTISKRNCDLRTKSVSLLRRSGLWRNWQDRSYTRKQNLLPFWDKLPFLIFVWVQELPTPKLSFHKNTAQLSSPMRILYVTKSYTEMLLLSEW